MSNKNTLPCFECGDIVIFNWIGNSPREASCDECKALNFAENTITVEAEKAAAEIAREIVDAEIARLNHIPWYARLMRWVKAMFAKPVEIDPVECVRAILNAELDANIQRRQVKERLFGLVVHVPPSTRKTVRVNLSIRGREDNNYCPEVSVAG